MVNDAFEKQKKFFLFLSQWLVICVWEKGVIVRIAASIELILTLLFMIKSKDIDTANILEFLMIELFNF